MKICFSSQLWDLDPIVKYSFFLVFFPIYFLIKNLTELRKVILVHVCKYVSV